MRRFVAILHVVLVLVSAGLAVYALVVKEERPPPVYDYYGNECEDAWRDLYSGPFTDYPCDDIRRWREERARQHQEDLR